MAKIAVVTDSNSGITVADGRKLGVYVMPMPVQIDGTTFYEGENLTQDDFYRHMAAGAELSTSQPAPGDITGLWDRVLEEHDGLVYIPMSAGLSSSCATAQMLAQGYQGRVQVVDNRRISIVQRYAVLDALALAQAGHSASDIRTTLEEQGDDFCIYITVDTLKYLRKGGRVNGVEALAGAMLNIKPVMEIARDKLTPVAKVRGMKAARKLMLERVRADVEGRLKPLRDSGHLAIKMACSQVSPELWEDWRAEIHAAFPDEPVIEGDPLTLSVAVHTGPGALGVGAVRI